MRTFLVRAALIVLVTPAIASAQTPVMTESEIISQLNESPRIRTARAGVDVTRADALAAGRWPNPRVTFNREAVAGIAEEMITVTQPLPLSGRRRLELSAATVRVDASLNRAEDQIRRVRADLRLAYADLWAAQEREQELGRNRDRLNELAAILGKREAAGESAGFDRLRAEREVVDIDANRSLAATERVQAQAILASFLPLSRDASSIQAARPPAVKNATLPAVEDLVARAEKSRGDLIALAKEADAAAFAERAAARRLIPEPEVVAGTKTSNAGSGDVGTIVSVHAAVPLFDRARPERAAAEARGRQARAEADVLRHTIRAQIAAWRAAVLERRTVAERYRSTSSADVDRIERIAQVSYEAGERGILELLDAYRTASSARIRQVELDRAVREAEVELEFVSGWEIP
jgi:cobalt-zinc-cadmium efflux system outer membrane protein